MFPAFRLRFNRALRLFIVERRKAATVRGIDAMRLHDAAARFAQAPGKRLRPYLAYRAAVDGRLETGRALKLALALELFHAFALIHDDLMDRSDMRRGRPSLHRAFEIEHRRRRLKGDAANYGAAMAILAGDLLLVWADAALHDAADKRPPKGLLREWDVMRAEVMLGQALDVSLPTLRRPPARRDVLAMLAVKSGRYSIGRPLLLGLALAERHADEQTVLRATEPLGIAFQHRDDILGTFGSARETGKSVDSDIREGKISLLAWETRRRLQSAKDAAAWNRGFGRRNASRSAVAAVRRLMEKTGARDAVEKEIRRLTGLAQRRLKKLPFPYSWLLDLAATLAARKS